MSSNSKDCLKLAALFSDHVVLQRDRKIPIWGWATAGRRILVSLAAEEVSTVVPADGRWEVTLPARPAGGPYVMTVSGDGTRRVRDVWVGEVWICAGQSNMEFTVEEAGAPKQVAAAARHPQIRMFTVAKVAAVARQEDVQGTWVPCSPRTVGRFSAAGYHFGLALRKSLDVPIGLIFTAWGGTRAEAWVDRETLASSPRFRKILRDYERNLPPSLRDQEAGERRMTEGDVSAYPRDPGNSGWSAGWANPESSSQGWGTMNLPRYWQEDGHRFSGVFWFRKELDLPASWAGKDLILRLCPCDKHDTTYFNNEMVGGLGEEVPEAYSRVREYRIPGHLVRAGRNLIAVRIYSYVYSGGMVGDPAQMRLELAGRPKNKPLSLAGTWHFRIEHNFGLVTTIQNSPYAVYRGMLEPMVPFAFRGVIWYQGESNVGRAEDYRVLFPLLIRSWRKIWKQGDFPFLFGQLPNYLAIKPEPVESEWAELREAQAEALGLPHTGMAVLIDIGDAEDIHPKNKEDVGGRLAAWALSRVYGLSSVAPSGPLYRSSAREGDRIRIRFTHDDGGLRSTGGSLKGFALAGADRKFVWAEARIEKGTVVVMSAQVPRPVAVRSAWGDNPVCNLGNAVGLPAAPFRSDRWKKNKIDVLA